MSNKWGKFQGDVYTRWVSNDPRNMEVTGTIRYYDPRGEQWTARAHNYVDGASTGWFFRRLFPAFVGRYRRASVFHDVYCNLKICPSWEVHRMFYEASRCDGTHPVVAWLMWAAVRTFGPRFKGPA